MRHIAIPVGDISEQIRGVSYGKGDATGSPSDGYLPVLRAGNITEFGVNYGDLIYVPKRFVSEKQLLRSGDVLIAASSGSLDVVGKAAPVLTDYNGAFGAFCKVLRPQKSYVEPRYFAHYFKTTEYRRTVSNLAAGANINNLKNEHLNELLIPLPPLEEQRRIAAILDKADALRTKRREALAQLDRLAQSIFMEMFGDPVLNPKGLPLRKLGSVGKLDRGVSKHRPRNAPELLGGPYPLIQTGDVANSGGYISRYANTYSELGLSQSKLWPSGTLCITIAANIAKTGILCFDACFPDSVVGFTAEHPATVEYVRIWLSFLQKTLEDSAPESAQKNINLAILRNLEIPLPSIELQENFLKGLQKINALHRSQSAHLTIAEKLFNSLQHRAFQGEL